MNYKICTIIGSMFIVGACDTEPELNYDHLNEYVFVQAVLDPRIPEEGDTTWVEQLIIVQQLYPVAFLAFGDSLAPFIDSATVVVSDANSDYFYTGIGLGRYRWRGPSNFVKPGTEYTLHISLPDGDVISAVHTVPKISWGIDTLYIWPDSIISWYDAQPGSMPKPKDVRGPGIKNIINFNIIGDNPTLKQSLGSQSFFNSWFISSAPGAESHLWIRNQQGDSTITLSIATDTTAAFYTSWLPTSVEINYSLHPEPYDDWQFVLHDDNFPIKDLINRSNLSGALGIFTSLPQYSEVNYVLAVDPNWK